MTATQTIIDNLTGRENYDVLLSESNTPVHNYRKSLCIRTIIKRDGTISAKYIVSWASRSRKRVVEECIRTCDTLVEAVDQYETIY